MVHYDLVMTTVGELDRDLAIAKKDEIKKAYRDLCGSENFQRTLSGGLQNKGAIVRRRSEWDQLLKDAIDGV